MLRIRIRPIRMFLGLLDPDPYPLVRGTDPDPSVIKEDFKMHTGSQGHGSADPDLDQHQNIMRDPQHC